MPQYYDGVSSIIFNGLKKPRKKFFNERLFEDMFCSDGDPKDHELLSYLESYLKFLENSMEVH